MSKILKALKSSKLDNNRGTLNSGVKDSGVISPVNFMMDGVNGGTSKLILSVVVCLVVAGSGIAGLRTARILDQTNRKIFELSSLVEEQNRMIGVMSEAIKETPAINPQEVARLQSRVQEIEETVAVNAEEVSEAVISNNLLKIAVDDLQISEHVFVDQYITLSRDLKHIQEKINMEGRNL